MDVEVWGWRGWRGGGEGSLPPPRLEEFWQRRLAVFGEGGSLSAERRGKSRAGEWIN